MNTLFQWLHSQIYWSKQKFFKRLPIMGSEQISKRGHRAYVGSKWDEVGPLQLEFMIQNGLRKYHKFYDIGCGCLRAGVHFIKYLDPGNYFGIDMEQDLINIGIEQELGKKLYNEKKPEFITSAEFEFKNFSCSPDYAIAQSLFTHLTLKDIGKCLQRLKDVSNDCHFFASFDEEDVTPKPKSRQGLPNPPWSHSNLTFYYNFSDIAKCAKKTGWEATYLGEWGHPSHQQMIFFCIDSKLSKK
jgi:SAM-dependent methyltransferase